MRSKTFFFTILFSLSTIIAGASLACNTGNYLYPNATGGYNSSGDPLYYNTNPITIRWWDQDPNCGIRDNKIKYRTNGDDNCQIVGGSWGVIYVYNASDNNCIPLPIDDYIPLLVLLVALTGAYFLRKRLAVKQV